MDKRRNLIDKTFKDQDNNLALFRPPNLPLVTWFMAAMLQKILPHGQLAQLAELVSFGALFTWAWLEIFQGDNYFRRALGAAVMATSLIIRL